MTWALVYTKQAQKDALKLASAGLKEKAKALLLQYGSVKKAVEAAG